LVKIGGNPSPYLIELHPSYYQEGTAEGEALRAHELCHVQQRERIPDFALLFDQMARATEAAGMPPWENPYEKECYQLEEVVRQDLLARGFPPAAQTGR
jgi:hypothetical protein